MGENADLATRSAVEPGKVRGSTYVSNVIWLLLKADEVLDVDDGHFRTLSARRGTIKNLSETSSLDGFSFLFYFLRRVSHPSISRLKSWPAMNLSIFFFFPLTTGYHSES